VKLGAELLRGLELLVDEIDGDDATAGDPGELDREVPEPADAEVGDEVGRARPRDLDGLVGRDGGAGERRRVERIDARRQLDGVAGVCGRVLAEAAVGRVPPVLPCEAERLPAGTQSSQVPHA
jgi:hypothetical protein